MLVPVVIPFCLLNSRILCYIALCFAVISIGTVNLHPSILPLYRGAAPVQRALQVPYPARISSSIPLHAYSYNCLLCDF